jgi:hypothetical protein
LNEPPSKPPLANRARNIKATWRACSTRLWRRTGACASSSPERNGRKASSSPLSKVKTNRPSRHSRHSTTCKAAPCSPSSIRREMRPSKNKLERQQAISKPTATNGPPSRSSTALRVTTSSSTKAQVAAAAATSVAPNFRFPYAINVPLALSAASSVRPTAFSSTAICCHA